jgi:hypothetical protein
MTPDPKNFDLHKLVVAHEILVNGDVDGAINYIDGVEGALAPELPRNPNLKASVNELEALLAVLRAAKDLAAADALTVAEYLKQFKKI